MIKLKHNIYIVSKLIFIVSFILVSFNIGYCQSKWRFAVVGDTHIGSSDTVAEMIPFMLADDIDLVLLPGDIVEGGLACNAVELKSQLSEWLGIFEPLYAAGVGVYPLRGNHENDARNNIAVWNEVFQGKYSLPQNCPEGENGITYSFNHKNALFVGLDNYVNIHTVNQTWLNTQLATNSNPHVFVFGHEAAFKVFHADCLDDSIEARNTFWKSLANAGVKVYFCGHDHFLDVALVNDTDGNDDNNIFQYLVGSGGGWLMSNYNYNGNNSNYTLNHKFHENEFGYSLIEVSGDSPEDRTVTITWKKRVWNQSTSSNEYLSTLNIIQYNSNPTTSIQTQTQIPASVWPNPTSSSIVCSGLSGKSTIYNSVGSAVWIGFIEDSTPIDVSSLSAGLYFIKDKSSVLKFIKSN